MGDLKTPDQGIPHSQVTVRTNTVVEGGAAQSIDLSDVNLVMAMEIYIPGASDGGVDQSAFAGVRFAWTSAALADGGAFFVVEPSIPRKIYCADKSASSVFFFSHGSDITEVGITFYSKSDTPGTPTVA